VRRTADEPLFNSLMEQYHYLKYEQPVGEHLNIWPGRKAVPSRAWRGVQRRVIWAAGTATSVGARKHGGATSVSSPTILDFLFCPGSRCLI
jgi:hypothetical protein